MQVDQMIYDFPPVEYLDHAARRGLAIGESGRVIGQRKMTGISSGGIHGRVSFKGRKYPADILWKDMVLPDGSKLSGYVFVLKGV